MCVCTSEFYFISLFSILRFVVIWTRINTLQFCLKDETNELTEIYFLFFFFVWFGFFFWNFNEENQIEQRQSYMLVGDQCSFSYWLAMRIRAPASHSHTSLLCAHIFGFSYCCCWWCFVHCGSLWFGLMVDPLFVHTTNIMAQKRDVLHALWSTNGSVVRLMKFCQAHCAHTHTQYVCAAFLIWFITFIFLFFHLIFVSECVRVRSNKRTTVHVCLHLSLAQVAKSRVS